MAGSGHERRFDFLLVDTSMHYAKRVSKRIFQIAIFSRYSRLSMKLQIKYETTEFRF